jgi:hypothetical protein
MSQLNRRNALTVVAGLPALAIPAVAIAAAGIPDPIFAAIDAHKRSMATFSAFCEGPEYENNDAEGFRLCGISCDAARNMLLTVPTTLAGAVELLRHVIDCENGGTKITLLFMERDDEEGEHGCDALISSLLSSLSKIAAS